MRPSIANHQLAVLAERHAKAETDVMGFRILNRKMIANFESQSDAFLEPVIYTAAKVDAVGYAVAKKERVTTIDEWNDFAGLARIKEVIVRTSRKNTNG